MIRCGLLLALGLATAATAAAAPAVETYTLKNGLRVVLAPDAQARAVDVAVWYATGPRFEPAGRSGLTHVFERLMFRGAEGVPSGDYRRLLLAEGATVNTYSAPDFSSFFATLPASALDVALKLEAARMAKLRITAAELDEDRAFVRRERRSVVDVNPITQGMERLYAAAFPSDGYGRLLLGTDADLARIALADAEAYYRERYGPTGATLTVVGAFDPAAARAAVRRWFEPIPKRATSTAKVAAPAPPQPRVSGRIAGRSPLLAMSWRTPPSADPSALSLDLLARILSTRYAERTRSRDAALTATRASFDARRSASLFTLVGLARPGADSTAAERELNALVADLEEHPIAAAELDRAKRSWELETLTERQTVRGRARELGSALLVDGTLDAVDRRTEHVRNLTAEEVQADVTKVLRDDARTVLWMRPTGAAPERATGEDAR